jgi:hypothetical protein
MLGTVKITELWLVGWGSEAMTKVEAMEISGEVGSEAMATVGVLGSETDIRIKTLVYRMF